MHGGAVVLVAYSSRRVRMAHARKYFQRAFFIISAITLVLLYTAMLLGNSTSTTATFFLPNASIAHPPLHGMLANLAEPQEPRVDELLQILQARLHNYTGPKINWTDFKCHGNITGAEACYDPTCPGQFSSSLRERLTQVLSARSAISRRYLQALTSAALPVTSHKYIFVTGASSNHYKETQALLYGVFHFLFPRLRGEDYTLVVYNLGLTARQRTLTEQNCRCTLLDFPFAALPEFVKHLKCYVWKPLIVASLLEKAEYLVWMDASIRWLESTPVKEILQRTKSSGFQTRHNGASIALFSQASTAQFFGDRLCQYAPFTEMEAGLVFYYNDRLMREVILPAWLSCAFSRDCMCLRNHTEVLQCVGPRRYGLCHRFEQSSIGMVLSKLFLEYRPMLYVPDLAVGVARNHEMNWFESG